MEIINETPSDKVAKIVVCTNCGITLKYVPNDTIIEKRTDYTGCSDSYKVITCPKCKKRMTVS